MYLWSKVLVHDVPFFLCERSVPNRQPINWEAAIQTILVHKASSQNNVPGSQRCEIGSTYERGVMLFFFQDIVDVDLDSFIHLVNNLQKEKTQQCYCLIFVKWK